MNLRRFLRVRLMCLGRQMFNLPGVFTILTKGLTLIVGMLLLLAYFDIQCGWVAKQSAISLLNDPLMLFKAIVVLLITIAFVAQYLQDDQFLVKIVKAFMGESISYGGYGPPKRTMRIDIVGLKSVAPDIFSQHGRVEDILANNNLLDDERMALQTFLEAHAKENERVE